MNLFLNTRIHTFVYLLCWLFIAVTHFALLFFVANMDYQFAIADSIIYTTVFLLLSLSIRYIIKYVGKNRGFQQQVFNHIASAVAFLSIWLTLSYLIFSVFTILIGEQPQIELRTLYPIRIFEGIFIYTVIALMEYIAIYIARVKEQTLMHEQIESRLKESQLKALKSQINPHFLFNSLNSISYLVTENPENARNMLSVLADYFRYSVKSMESTTTLQNEITNCQRYLEIEKIRFEERLIVNETIDPSALQTRLPAMTLQPLYENAIKHGVYESFDPVTINTKIQAGTSHVKISISNSYDPETIPRRGEGVGVKSVSERLRLMFELKGVEKSELENLINISKEDGLYTVTLTIPKEEL